MRRQVVVIRWKDAAKYGTETRRMGDCDQAKPMELMSVGILLNETDDYIVLGNDLSEYHETVRDVNVYLKNSIVSRDNMCFNDEVTDEQA